MKKSVFAFGLLLSSLVMLSALPLLNNNNNAAMGQGYDIYRENSYYSQYPTDDKKYECRTGPFEGFFVSSVEFCKHVKFDKDNDRKDNRDNRTGTQGPPGPPGPQGDPGATGATGAQGPGITQLNATNVYLVQNSSGAPEPGRTFAFIPALCDPGDLVLNGGYNVIGSIFRNNDSLTTAIDQPIAGPILQLNGTLGAGWITFVRINEDPSSSDLILNVYALCFDNPPPH